MGQGEPRGDVRPVQSGEGHHCQEDLSPRRRSRHVRGGYQQGRQIRRGQYQEKTKTQEDMKKYRFLYVNCVVRQYNLSCLNVFSFIGKEISGYIMV